MEAHSSSGVSSGSGEGSAEQSYTHKAVTLQVSNLSYEVDDDFNISSLKRYANKLFCRKRDIGRKLVLNGVSFEVNSGQMLAIMGSSGSGKTSLLDVIACRNSSGQTNGQALLNGALTSQELIQRYAGYVRQDDHLLPHLTVKETLVFVAHLKLPTYLTRAEIENRVDSVIQELGLRHVADTKVGGVEIRGISGGERKRVSIAVQLLLDPSLLFLDEPTSGLDSFTAHHLVETLAKLARNNRTVLLTIHQPRSDIFELFDLVMLLSQGSIVYYGEAKNMVPYFTQLNYPCPELTNPADFYVDLATVDAKTSQTESESTNRVKSLIETYKQQKTIDPTDATQETSSNLHNKLNTNTRFHNNHDRGARDLHKHQPGCWTQFSVLFRRTLSNNLNDYGFLGIQALEALAMSFVIGLVFYNLQYDQFDMRDRFGLMYIVGALYPYMVVIDILGKYYSEKPILYFEMQDGLYTPGPYFFSKIFSDIPEQTVYVIIYTIPLYWLANLQNDFGLFMQFFGTVYMAVYCSRCLALMSASLLPSFQISTIFSQGIFAVCLLSAGFIINIDNIFIGVKWVNEISYLKWGFASLCLTEFPGLQFSCTDGFGKCIHNGTEALKYYSMDKYHIWEASTVVGAEIVFLLALFYGALKLISQKPYES